MVQSVYSKDSKEKEQGIITESPIKNLWKLFYYGKKRKHFFWFVNNSEYDHREMDDQPFSVYDVECLCIAAAAHNWDLLVNGSRKAPWSPAQYFDIHLAC